MNWLRCFNIDSTFELSYRPILLQYCALDKVLNTKKRVLIPFIIYVSIHSMFIRGNASTCTDDVTSIFVENLL